MEANTSTGEQVVARLSKDNWVGIIGIAMAQLVVIVGWGLALDRRVTKMETVVESYRAPLDAAMTNAGILQRIDQSLIDINRRLENLEDKKP